MVGLGVGFADVAGYVSHNDLGTAVLLAELDAGRIRRGRLVLAGSCVVYGESPGRCPEHGLMRSQPRPAEQLSPGAVRRSSARTAAARWCRSRWPRTRRPIPATCTPPRSSTRSTCAGASPASATPGGAACATTTCTARACHATHRTPASRRSFAARSRRAGHRRCSRTAPSCATSSTCTDVARPRSLALDADAAVGRPSTSPPAGRTRSARWRPRWRGALRRPDLPPGRAGASGWATCVTCSAPPRADPSRSWASGPRSGSQTGCASSPRPRYARRRRASRPTPAGQQPERQPSTMARLRQVVVGSRLGVAARSCRARSAPARRTGRSACRTRSAPACTGASRRRGHHAAGQPAGREHQRRQQQVVAMTTRPIQTANWTGSTACAGALTDPEADHAGPAASRDQQPRR